MDKRSAATTVPEGREIPPQNNFRKAVHGIFARHDRYELSPGSTLAIKLPKEEVLRGGGSISFIMIPGKPVPESINATVMISAFWMLPSDTQNAQTSIRYFCGKPEDLVKESLDIPLGEEFMIGRQKPAFSALIGLNIVSKVHARIWSSLDTRHCQLTIEDGGPERPSSYGITILTHPEIAISHIGEVTLWRRSTDPLTTLR